MLLYLVYAYFVVAPFVYYARIATAAALVALDALLATIALVMLADLALGRRLPRLTQTGRAVLVAWLGLVVYLGVQVVNPEGRSLGSSIEGFRGHALASVMLLACAMAMRGAREVRRMLMIVMITGVVVALVGIRQRVIGYTPYEQQWVAVLGQLRLRVFSTMGSAHLFALYMAMVILVSIYTRRTWRAAGRGWAALSASVCGVGLVLSYMRGPLLALAGAFVLGAGLTLVCVRRHALRQLCRGLAIGAIVIALGGTALVSMGERGEATLEVVAGIWQGLGRLEELYQRGSEDRSASVRMEEIRDAVTFVMRKPFGKGLGMYKGLDNYYFGVLGETGWLGVGLFLLLIGCGALAGVDRLRGSCSHQVFAYRRALFVSCGVVLIGSLSSPPLFTPMFAGYFWAFLGALIRFEGDEGRAAESPVRARQEEAARPNAVTNAGGCI